MGAAAEPNSSHCVSHRTCRLRGCQGSLSIREELKAQQSQYIERLLERQAGGKARLDASDNDGKAADEKALLEVSTCCRQQSPARVLHGCRTHPVVHLLHRVIGFFVRLLEQVIKEKRAMAIQKADEKIAVASQTHDIVDGYIRCVAVCYCLLFAAACCYSLLLLLLYLCWSDNIS
jgi:hypothetical protein